jgi:predicted MFS family arabinose efflux permease
MPTPRQVTPSESTRYLSLIAIFRVTRSVSAGMITIAFPYLILRKLHASPLVLGLLYTAGALATAFIGMLFGFLTDLWGQKKTLVIAGLMLPLSAALVFASRWLPALFLACMLGGFSATGSLMGGGVGGAAQPPQVVVLADLTARDKRTFIFSLFTFISGITAALGALLARLFTARDAFAAATLISLLGIACLIPVHFSEYRGKLGRLQSKAMIGKFTLTGTLNGFAAGLIVPFLIPFFVIVYHVPKSEMSVYGFVAGSLASLAVLTAPRLDQVWGFVGSIAVTRGVGVALLLLLPLVHDLPLALLVYFVTPALRVAAMPVQRAAMTELVRTDELGRGLGLNQVARLAASSGSIAFTGYMFDLSDIGLPFYAYAAVMAFNILLYIRFFRGAELRTEEP